MWWRRLWRPSYVRHTAMGATRLLPWRQTPGIRGGSRGNVPTPRIVPTDLPPLVSTPADHQPPRAIVHLGRCAVILASYGAARVKGRKKLLYLYWNPLNGISFDNAHGRSCFLAVANCCLNKFCPLLSFCLSGSFCIDRILSPETCRQIQSSNTSFPYL